MMKRFLTVLTLCFMVVGLSAQSKEAATLQKAYTKNKATVQDPKKGNAAANWIKYGQGLLDAYDLPIKNLWAGLSATEAKVILKDQKPLSTKNQTIQADQHQVVTYEDKVLYYNSQGKLAFWTVSKPVLENVNMLDDAFAAFVKAAELDSKPANTKLVSTALEGIRNRYLNDAMTAYSLGNPAEASVLFEKSLKCGEHPALNTLDTMVVYYVAYTADLAKDVDRSQAYFQKCVELNFTQNGEAYARLAEIYKQKGEKDKCEEMLSQGFVKFPDSQSILVSLINFYMENDEDSNKLLDYIHRAQENEPSNASLFYAEGNVHKKLGDVARAVECYQKSVEVVPEYAYGYFAMGVAFYEKAVEIQTKAADELDDAKYMALLEELDKNLEAAIDPFEKCKALAQEDEIKNVVAEYLKNIYFRLRSKNPEYEKAYNEYVKPQEGQE